MEYERDSSGKRYFTKDDGFMSTVYEEVTMDEYVKLCEMPYAEASRCITDKYVSNSILCGYGYYGFQLFKDENDVCFVGIKSGNSCD